MPDWNSLHFGKSRGEPLSSVCLCVCTHGDHEGMHISCTCYVWLVQVSDLLLCVRKEMSCTYSERTVWHVCKGKSLYLQIIRTVSLILREGAASLSRLLV